MGRHGASSSLLFHRQAAGRAMPQSMALCNRIVGIRGLGWQRGHFRPDLREGSHPVLRLVLQSPTTARPSPMASAMAPRTCSPQAISHANQGTPERNSPNCTEPFCAVARTMLVLLLFAEVVRKESDASGGSPSGDATTSTTARAKRVAVCTATSTDPLPTLSNRLDRVSHPMHRVLHVIENLICQRMTKNRGTRSKSGKASAKSNSVRLVSLDD
jgi:hypothetical protein